MYPTNSKLPEGRQVFSPNCTKYRHSEPLLLVNDSGNPPKTQGPGCQPRANLVNKAFRGPQPQACCDLFLHVLTLQVRELALRSGKVSRPKVTLAVMESVRIQALWLQSCWQLMCNCGSGLTVTGWKSIWFQILSPPCLPACLCGNKTY